MADNDPVRHPLLPSLLAGDRAPAPRTLVEVLRETAGQHPDEPAVDSGVAVLTYAELVEAADNLADELAGLGVGPGDKVAVRVRSGTTDLYVAILGVLCAGAAYVPIDADDPDERARVVVTESRAVAVVGNDLVVAPTGDRPAKPRRDPTPADDAWVIFTSGSTGDAEGRRGHAPQRGRLRRRRGAALPPGRADRAGRPGDGRPQRRLRRQL